MTGETTQPRPSRRSRLATLRSGRGRTQLLVVALVAAAAIGFGGWVLAAMQGRAVEQTERADAAEVEARISAENAAAFAEEIRTACAQEDETAELLGDLCRQADEVVEEPAEPTVVAPTEEQLRPLVRAFVDDWLARNPPRDGRDGQTPTVDEIAAVVAIEVAAELAENPPPAGPRGEPGPAPTAAQLQPIVAAEVSAWLLANPPAPGEPGQPGEDGEDGEDSTVPGPAGEDGEDGQDGADGQDGEPPLSWTFTHCTVLDGCVTYRCSRSEPFDPSSPEYSCEPVEG